ncbi:MAG TPA: RNA polymerase sigma factor region1.1 domain-containing protein, partial [Gaiellaceae bacterium]|nr:RNA polymerase sigma factor region1.1 domain-containing protein [Gaiellaceae bacterium]
MLETESAKTLVERGEERGWIEPAELEAFVAENDLADGDVEDLVRELERIGLEVRDAVPDDKKEKKE